MVDNDNYKEHWQERLTTLSIIIKAIHWNIKELIKDNIDVEGNKKG
ncbi:hypothetical protein P8V03_18835 [Clostridium sp. A1-XYC3]|uniref:Uncharacterized protein n=1 Tax=Clostridium tanneri TaxID=3037988 RepID=A0ABU4JYK1_9CLOT|nr:hypothetical protein [Clostridium sp. A1-XYC3]MDW8803187.1 hypothetical protein [Clostridium sp. A1-XYC3]